MPNTDQVEEDTINIVAEEVIGDTFDQGTLGQHPRHAFVREVGQRREGMGEWAGGVTAANLAGVRHVHFDAPPIPDAPIEEPPGMWDETAVPPPLWATPAFTGWAGAGRHEADEVPAPTTPGNVMADIGAHIRQVIGARQIEQTTDPIFGGDFIACPQSGASYSNDATPEYRSFDDRFSDIEAKLDLILSFVSKEVQTQKFDF